MHCRLIAIKWKISKETGGYGGSSLQKIESPANLQKGDVALCSFQALQPASTFCRVLFLDGHDDVMRGRIVRGEGQVDILVDTGGKKKMRRGNLDTLARDVKALIAKIKERPGENRRNKSWANWQSCCASRQ